MAVRVKPITQREDFHNKGGTTIIAVTCLPYEIFFLEQLVLRGRLYKSTSMNSWFVNCKGFCKEESLDDYGIGREPRYNLHVIFPFSSRLLVVLQDFIQKRDFDGYIDFVSNSLSGEDKEKWDAYVESSIPRMMMK